MHGCAAEFREIICLVDRNNARMWRVQLQYPEPVQIIERYDPDFANEEEFLTEEQRQLRREKSEKYKKMLAAHRYV